VRDRVLSLLSRKGGDVLEKFYLNYVFVEGMCILCVQVFPEFDKAEAIECILEEGDVVCSICIKM
jgi:hypothetical protein